MPGTTKGANQFMGFGYGDGVLKRPIFNNQRSIASQAADLLSRYDRDHDGSISIKNGEATRTENFGGKYNQFSSSTYSIENLVRRADQMGNRDGKVTQAELARVMRSFDTGDGYMPSERTRRASAHDGVLSGTEQDSFNQSYGERYVGNNEFPPPPVDPIDPIFPIDPVDPVDPIGPPIGSLPPAPWNSPFDPPYNPPFKPHGGCGMHGSRPTPRPVPVPPAEYDPRMLSIGLGAGAAASLATN